MIQQPTSISEYLQSLEEACGDAQSRAKLVADHVQHWLLESEVARWDLSDLEAVKADVLDEFEQTKAQLITKGYPKLAATTDEVALIINSRLDRFSTI